MLLKLDFSVGETVFIENVQEVLIQIYEGTLQARVPATSQHLLEILFNLLIEFLSHLYHAIGCIFFSTFLQFYERKLICLVSLYIYQNFD